MFVIIIMDRHGRWVNTFFFHIWEDEDLWIVAILMWTTGLFIWLVTQTFFWKAISQSRCVTLRGSEVNDADQLLRRLGWQSFWAATLLKTGGRFTASELVTETDFCDSGWAYFFVNQFDPEQNAVVQFRCNESMTGPVMSLCQFVSSQKKVPSALQRRDSGVVYQLYFRGLECLGRDCGGFVPKSQSDTGIHWESCGIYNLWASPIFRRKS